MRSSYKLLLFSSTFPIIVSFLFGLLYGWYSIPFGILAGIGTHSILTKAVETINKKRQLKAEQHPAVLASIELQLDLENDNLDRIINESYDNQKLAPEKDLKELKGKIEKIETFEMSEKIVDWLFGEKR